MRNIRPGWKIFLGLSRLERARIVARTQGYAPSWFIPLEQNPPMPRLLEGPIPKNIVLEEDRVRSRLLDLFPNYQSYTVRGIVGEDRWYTNPVEKMLRRYRNLVSRGSNASEAFSTTVQEHEDELEATGIALSHQTYQAMKLGVAPLYQPEDFEKARAIQQGHYALSPEAEQRRKRDTLARLCYEEIVSAQREKRPINRIEADVLSTWSISQNDLLRVLADYPQLECCFEPMARITNILDPNDRYYQPVQLRGTPISIDYKPDSDDEYLPEDDSSVVESWDQLASGQVDPAIVQENEVKFEQAMQAIGPEVREILKTLELPRRGASFKFGSYNVDDGILKRRSANPAHSTTQHNNRSHTK